MVCEVFLLTQSCIFSFTSSFPFNWGLGLTLLPLITRHSQSISSAQTSMLIWLQVHMSTLSLCLLAFISFYNQCLYCLGWSQWESKAHKFCNHFSFPSSSLSLHQASPRIPSILSCICSPMYGSCSCYPHLITMLMKYTTVLGHSSRKQMGFGLVVWLSGRKFACTMHETLGSIPAL